MEDQKVRAVAVGAQLVPCRVLLLPNRPFWRAPWTGKKGRGQRQLCAWWGSCPVGGDSQGAVLMGEVGAGCGAVEERGTRKAGDNEGVGGETAGVLAAQPDTGLPRHHADSLMPPCHATCVPGARPAQTRLGIGAEAPFAARHPQQPHLCRHAALSGLRWRRHPHTAKRVRRISDLGGGAAAWLGLCMEEGTACRGAPRPGCVVAWPRLVGWLSGRAGCMVAEEVMSSGARRGCVRAPLHAPERTWQVSQAWRQASQARRQSYNATACPARVAPMQTPVQTRAPGAGRNTCDVMALGTAGKPLCRA